MHRIWATLAPWWPTGHRFGRSKQIKGFYLLMNLGAKLTGLEQAKIESDGYEGKWARTCFSFELICPKGWTPVSKRMHLVFTFLKEVVRNYRFFILSAWTNGLAPTRHQLLWFLFHKLAKFSSILWTKIYIFRNQLSKSRVPFFAFLLLMIFINGGWRQK